MGKVETGRHKHSNSIQNITKGQTWEIVHYEKLCTIASLVIQTKREYTVALIWALSTRSETHITVTTNNCVIGFRANSIGGKQANLA